MEIRTRKQVESAEPSQTVCTAEAQSVMRIIFLIKAEFPLSKEPRKSFSQNKRVHFIGNDFCVLYLRKIILIFKKKIITEKFSCLENFLQEILLLLRQVSEH